MKPTLAGVLTLLVITVGILGGCKSRVSADQQPLSQQPSSVEAARAVPQSEEKSDVALHRDDDPGNATGTVAQTTKKVPACPKGAVERSWTANGEKRYACQAPGQKTDQGLDACYEWEETYWNPEPALPCGSSVSSVSDKQYLAAVKEEEEHDCHKAKTLATFMGTNAETRGAFASKGATAIWQQGRVLITAAGDDKEYLLFSADPQDSEAVNNLTQLWLEYVRSVGLRVRACGEGFKEIQFITRDDKYEQKMIGRVVPSTKELVHETIKSNAQPMR